MLDITENARRHFVHLLQAQGDDAIGILLGAKAPGTPHAEVQLTFCERADLAGDEWAIECEGFTLYVDAASARHFDGAVIDYAEQATGGQLNIRAPKLKGELPGGEASLVEKVRWLLDAEINPQLAAHGGRVALEAVTAEGAVVLRFGGGCHGCGMVDRTLKQGIERTLHARLPEITAVLDATDHSTGERPYYRRQG